MSNIDAGLGPIRQSDTSCGPERRDRRARRFKTFWPTSIRTADDVRRIHILDISCTGAKIHAQEAMDIGQELEVKIGEVWHDASIRWRRQNAFGIAFYKPLPNDALRISLARG